MAQNRKAAKGKNATVVSASKGSKKSFYVILAAAAVAGIAVLSYLASKGAADKIITLDPNLPPVTSQGYVLGSPTAPIELVELGDFECPSCARFAELTEPEIRAQYVNTGKVRFRFIDFPLSIHRNTVNASNAAACADEQGKFWEMHDLLFATQHEWNSETTNDPDKHFKAIGQRIQGIDASKLNECIDSRRHAAKVQSHLKIAVDRGAPGTPTFYVGNTQLNFRTNSFDEFKAYFDQQLAALAPAPGTTKKP
ncbi:MAG TPA: thioredoxin domain-containing protein [Gemmatimonadaceae bacterium]|nr:thioredoxin domain-containing protein [Gemmatimonadaceae bacterium]